MILYHFTLFCILSAPCLIGPTLISSSYLFSVSFILIAVLSTPPSDLPFADYILLLVFILPINSFILIFPHLLFFSFLSSSFFSLPFYPCCLLQVSRTTKRSTCGLQAVCQVGKYRFNQNERYGERDNIFLCVLAEGSQREYLRRERMGFCVSACMTVCVCVHEESKIERKRD